MSEVRANTISAADGTSPATLTKQWAAKASLEFTQVGTTAIRVSENISSITDAAVGRSNVDFTNAFSVAPSAALAGTFAAGSYISNLVIDDANGATTTTKAHVGSLNSTTPVDGAHHGAVFMGDLA